jgi:hypothetical protein
MTCIICRQRTAVRFNLFCVKCYQKRTNREQRLNRLIAMERRKRKHAIY